MLRRAVELVIFGSPIAVAILAARWASIALESLLFP